jgi:hypothetical protein
MKLREDITVQYRYYHNILEGIFAKAFSDGGNDYSIIFGPILAQTIGRLFNQDDSLFNSYYSQELTLGGEYGNNLVKHMSVPLNEKRLSNVASYIKIIFSTFRWLVYFGLVVIKIRLLNCRHAVDICDNKPDQWRRIKILLLTKYIVPPTLSKTARKIYHNISKIWSNEITELEFINIYRNFLNGIEGLELENKVILHNVLLELPSCEIINFRANKALARFLYRDFHFELLNCFYFDSTIAHAICQSKDLGCTFKVIQHGGGYGILDGNVYELFETEQFGDNFHYLDVHQIKSGNKENLSRRWSHLPAVNPKRNTLRRAILILSSKNLGLDTLTAKSDIAGSVKLITQIISLLRRIDENAILDILPYDDYQGDELRANALLKNNNVYIVDRTNRKYKFDEYSIILLDNFGTLFYEFLTIGLSSIVVNVYPLSSYQKDWLERVHIYINGGYFVWSVEELYGIAKSRLSD